MDNGDSDDVSQTRELLDRFWAAADPEGGTARGGAESLIAQAEHRNRDLPPSTEAALLRFDEFLLWTVSLATALNFTRSPSGSPAAVYGALAGGISSLLFSIRSLVLSGFDVPAKILMRSVVEYADVLFLLFTRPELVPAYAGVESFEEANQFWHRHLKSLKARKAAYESLSPGAMAGGAFVDLLGYQKQEEELMALSAHGAYVAAWMSSFPGSPASVEDGRIVWPGYLGAVSDHSTRTLDYVAYALFPLYASSDLPYGQGKQGRAVLDFDDSRLCRSIEARRHVLVQILQAGLSPDEEEPTEDA